MKHSIDACLFKNANDINFDEKHHLRHPATNSGLAGEWFLANLSATALSCVTLVGDAHSNVVYTAG